MEWKDHIVSEPKVLFGKPRVKGTRISVELILDKLGNGVTKEELMESYPNLTEHQIQACISFAADKLKSEVAYSDEK
ncbi:DUF433 domain-containing protein [Gracilimonas sediminicola]|uniref:DUF433 domain-containing protein n=1 Tax=Gracilimonas sediminicola TaxID=2952158 RepID=A0A9X2L1I7_9BACT|nr:DUF433 domain-containing protein [Gracilimonas sediminicola]MCP9290611.1 DUF433 domain-containing protein [Gracilimonas sediminicola]